jgi:hypothetical protein
MVPTLSCDASLLWRSALSGAADLGVFVAAEPRCLLLSHISIASDVQEARPHNARESTLKSSPLAPRYACAILEHPRSAATRRHEHPSLTLTPAAARAVAAHGLEAWIPMAHPQHLCQATRTARSALRLRCADAADVGPIPPCINSQPGVLQRRCGSRRGDLLHTVSDFTGPGWLPSARSPTPSLRSTALRGLAHHSRRSVSEAEHVARLCRRLAFPTRVWESRNDVS